MDFQDALKELKALIQDANTKGLDSKTETRIIRAFELTHELALNTITGFFRTQRHQINFSGSRDITVEAFNEDLIDDGKGWLDMVILRIKYNPIYPESTQSELVNRIIKNFISLFENFNRKMVARLEN